MKLSVAQSMARPCVLPTSRLSPARIMIDQRRLCSTRAAAAAAPPASGAVVPGLSYSEQYDRLYREHADSGAPFQVKQALPKPDPAAQAAAPGAKRIPFSEVYATPKVNKWLGRTYDANDYVYLGFMALIHGLALLAPFTFSWTNLGLFLGSYFVTGCLGITLSFHRQLSHRAFTTPKWMEYALAYCGVLSGQGEPMMWVSHHKYHHLHTDTPLDPHSIYEGFWWSHMGWLFNHKATSARVGDRSNVKDMEAQPYYRWLRDTYLWHVVGQFALLYAFGGLGAAVWGGALRMAWVYHVTWFVNSATHTWGYQPYDSGDQSRNNWWHNTHHTFEWSARHGLEWWEVDATWGLIWGLQKLGLATNVKLPTQRQLDAKRRDRKAAPAAA